MNTPTVARIAFLGVCLGLVLLGHPPATADGQRLEDRVEGVVSVSVADYFTPDKSGQMSGYSQTIYTIRVGSSEFVDLEGPDDLLATLHTGDRVVLQGRRETLKLFRIGAVVSQEAASDTAPEKAVLGVQDLAVIPVQFPNVVFSESVCPWNLIDSIAFTGAQSLTAYWEEASYGQLFFSNQSKTFDVVTLADPYVSGSGCTSNDLRLWATRADAMIGSEISAFNRRIYVFPAFMTNFCPFGLGDVGFNSGNSLTLSWVTGCNTPDAYIHEFGHNISLLHAYSRPESGPDVEYGDLGDIMGFGAVGVRKLNGPHVDHLDWMPDGEPYFATLTGVGTYDITLTALGRDYLVEPNPTQVLKIHAPSLGQDLYVSYRDNHGMDATLRSDYKFRTHIHTVRDGGAGSTILDAVPTGVPFEVSPDGISIVQMGTNPTAGTADVRVVIEMPNDCEEDRPVIALSTNPIYTAPGGTIDYTLEITNTDGVTCLPLDLSISASLPGATWSANQPIELAAPAGQTTVAVLSVTSPSNVTGFNYNFNIITSAPADVENEHLVILPVSYKIDRAPPTAPTDLLMTAATPDSVTMVWTASTDSQSGVGHYEILRSFGDETFAVIGQSPTPDFVDATAADGDFLWYLLRAVDNAGNSSN